MDLLRLGPQAPAERQAAAPSPEPGRRRRDAAVGALWTVGILCVFPQGLQLPVAAGFIVVGLLAIWWAEAIRRRGLGQAVP